MDVADVVGGLLLITALVLSAWHIFSRLVDTITEAWRFRKLEPAAVKAIHQIRGEYLRGKNQAILNPVLSANLTPKSAAQVCDYFSEQTYVNRVFNWNFLSKSSAQPIPFVKVVFWSHK